AAIKLAVGTDREPVGTAAGGRDDFLAAAGPAARDPSLLDLDDDDAAVVHHHRRLGEAQSVGDQFKLGHILSLSIVRFLFRHPGLDPGSRLSRCLAGPRIKSGVTMAVYS